MRRRILAGLALICAGAAAAPALAADVPLPMPDAPLPPAIEARFDWSGAYVGATIGYAWNDAEADAFRFDGTPVPIPPFSVPFDGVIGGGTAGFNLQRGMAVFGIEGDYSVLDAEGSYTAPSGDPLGAFTATARMKWLATVRGRVGVAFDRVLVYGTGGVAFGGVEASLVDVYQRGTFTNEASATHTGWTAGGGGEVALTERLTLKGEYLYYDLGDADYSFPLADTSSLIDARAAVTGSLVRVGINLKL